jgi:2-polyprenyl-6-methoxyphenol hydroxylase-like FAD-dependent oxidoreductase
LTDDPQILWIHGFRVSGQFDENTMIVPLKDKSTGRVSWIAPWSKTEADVLASDYCRLSEYKDLLASGYLDDAYGKFSEMCTNLDLCKIQDRVQIIRGKIRVVPLKNSPNWPKLFAVGDAAGQACPNMAEGVTPAFANSTALAENLIQNPNYTSGEHYNNWRHGHDRVAPYELSAAFLIGRLLKDRAGGNAAIYEALANTNDPDRMLRILSERRLRVKDYPDLVKLGLNKPEVLINALHNILLSQVVFKDPKYARMLYGI